MLWVKMKDNRSELIVWEGKWTSAVYPRLKYATINTYWNIQEEKKKGYEYIVNLHNDDLKITSISNGVARE